MFNPTSRQIKILKDYFPLLGQRKPRYHLSLYELLELNDQEIPYNQIYRYCINTLKLSIDIQKDITTGNKRCSQCLQKKNLSKFLKVTTNSFGGVKSVCKDCQSRYKSDKHQDWKFTLLSRLQTIIWREGRKWKKNQILQLIDDIVFRIGKPDKCFFHNERCMYEIPDQDRKSVKVDIGHIISVKKSGTITDPSNVIWICRRHNWMMGHYDLIEFKQIVDSMYKKLDS
jgi:hypothetical protein